MEADEAVGLPLEATLTLPKEMLLLELELVRCSKWSICLPPLAWDLGPHSHR